MPRRAHPRQRSAKLMESQKAVKLTICQCEFIVLRGVPAAVERFLRNRQNCLTPQNS